ncbi:MAG: hypothetical protein AABY05_02470 [Nanoarchaeota archaeon]
MLREKGLVDQLTAYIKSNLKKGYTTESLRWALVNQGYSRLEVAKSIIRAEQELANQAPVLKTKPEIKYEAIRSNMPEEKKGFFGRLFGF